MDFNFSLDLFTLGLVMAGNLVLGFLIFFENPRSLTSRLFLFLTVSVSIYSVFAFLSHHVQELKGFLWVLRFTMFSAVLFATSFFLVALNFPSETWLINKTRRYQIWILSIVTMLLTLSPFVFTGVHQAEGGGLPQPHVGFGMILFGLTVSLFDFGGIYILIKRVKLAVGQEKTQQKYVLTGFSITMLLILIFNFMLPVIFSNNSYIPYNVVFTTPFVIFTAYAIIRHHLLQIKIITTEIFTFLLAIVSLVEVLISQTTLEIVFRLSVFALVLIVGILLIRSVRKEVQQREELQILSKKLADANEQLKLLDKARADFITIASHQLRTPPSTIKWYLGSLLVGDYGEIPAEIKEQLQKAEITNNALISLIDDMLNASRIERGKMEFLFEETDVEAMTQFTVEQLMPLAGMKKLQLIYHKPTQPIPKIMADKEKLRQVINNFIDNALKYTKAGSVTVELKQDGESVFVYVTDTGRGLSNEEREALFEKYTRGKDAMTHSAGLGLGLYVAKIIIAQHKGKIWAESPGTGKGSTFAFSVPIKSDVPANSIVNLAAGG